MKKIRTTPKWIAAFFLALFSLHLVPLEWWHHHEGESIHTLAKHNHDIKGLPQAQEDHQCPVCDFHFTAFFKIQSQACTQTVTFPVALVFTASNTPIHSNEQLGFSLRGPPLA